MDIQSVASRVTAKQARRNEVKNQRGICRIQKRVPPSGPLQGKTTVGCGTLVKLKEDQIPTQWRRAGVKYAIITAANVFQGDFDLDSYFLDFKKSDRKLKTFKLDPVAKLWPFQLQDRAASGLTVIPLDSHAPEFRHGLFKKKCSVLRHGAIHVEPVNDYSDPEGFCCHMVAEETSSNRLFGVKTHKLTRVDSGRYQLDSLDNFTPPILVPLGCAILRRANGEWSLVGVQLSPMTSDPQTFQPKPVWLSSLFLADNLHTSSTSYLLPQDEPQQTTMTPDSVDAGDRRPRVKNERVAPLPVAIKKSSNMDPGDTVQSHRLTPQQSTVTPAAAAQSSSMIPVDQSIQPKEGKESTEDSLKGTTDNLRTSSTYLLPQDEPQQTTMTPGSKSTAEGKLNVTLVSDVGNWKNAVNTLLVLELAKDSRLNVSGFVPHHSEEQRNHARSLNIELVDADQDLSGYSPTELLDHPPDHLKIDVLLIHSYGPGLGRQAQNIRKLKKCKWAQVVHTISDELYTFLEDPQDCKDDHQLQVTLCGKADIIIAIGPKVAEAYRHYLRYTKRQENVIELTPGVKEELNGVRQVYRKADKFNVLVSGSSYYFKVKGCDIAAQAIKLLNASSYRLLFVVRPSESGTDEADIRQALRKEGFDFRQLMVRVTKNHADWHQWLCEADLVIKPSRTEGFGMSGLLAISANVPVLVSSFSGLGIILKKLSFGASQVVESDDPQVWADKIEEIRRKDPQRRHLQAEELRKEYTNLYSWKKQCDDLVDTFFEIAKQCHEGEETQLDSARRNEMSTAGDVRISESEPVNVVTTVQENPGIETVV